MRKSNRLLEMIAKNRRLSGIEERNSNLGIRRETKAEKRSRLREAELLYRLRTLHLGDKQKKVFRVYNLNSNNRPLDTHLDIPPPVLALEYYKTNNKGGDDYEFVELKMRMSVDCYTIHINFTARLKGSSNSDPQLFFAELKNSRPMTVTHCCKLDNITYPVGEIHPPDSRVLHCDCVKCDRCARELTIGRLR